MAVDEDSAIFGECKWKNETVGIGVLNDLIEKSKILGQYKNRYYVLFSKSGFSKEVATMASSMGNVELVSLERLYNRQVGDGS